MGSHGEGTTALHHAVVHEAMKKVFQGYTVRHGRADGSFRANASLLVRFSRLADGRTWALHCIHDRHVLS